MTTLKAAARGFLQLILSLCFVVVVCFSIQSLVMKETGISLEYDPRVRLPSITLCHHIPSEGYPFTFTLGKNQTLLDFYHQFEPVENDIVNATLKLFENEFSMLRPLNIDLKTSNLMTQGVTLSNAIPDHLVKCVTINMPILDLNVTTGLIIIYINTTRHNMLLVERHEQGQSQHHYERNWDTLGTILQDYYINAFLVPKKSIAVNTPRHSCVKENIFRKTDCINDFTQLKLGCGLPWIKNSEGKYGRVCNETKDLENYIQIFHNVHTEAQKQEFRNHGCMRVNCETYSWRMASYSETPFNTLHRFYLPNVSVIQYNFQRTTPTEVTRQTVIYGFANFVADFGGYLGLLLGASLLSFYDSVMELFHKQCRKQQETETLK